MNPVYSFYSALLTFLKKHSFSSSHAQDCLESYSLAKGYVTFPQITFKDLVEWNQQLHHSQKRGGVDNTSYGKGITRRDQFVEYAFVDLAPIFHKNQSIPGLLARIKAAADLKDVLFIYVCFNFEKKKGFERNSFIVEDQTSAKAFFTDPELFLNGTRRVIFCGPGITVRKEF
jgi:hypothetical protein